VDELRTTKWRAHLKPSHEIINSDYITISGEGYKLWKSSLCRFLYIPHNYFINIKYSLRCLSFKHTGLWRSRAASERNYSATQLCLIFLMHTKWFGHTRVVVRDASKITHLFQPPYVRISSWVVCFLSLVIYVLQHTLAREVCYISWLLMFKKAERPAIVFNSIKKFLKFILLISSRKCSY
jgi:hypothetical protein